MKSLYLSSIPLIAVASLAFWVGRQSAESPAPKQTPDNARLAQIYKEDQADREGPIEKLDWHKISERDLARQAEVKKLLDKGEVVTAKDYYHSAMVFQHASDKQGYKLAHELAWISASMGDKSARWLSAASWDRLLLSMGDKQRFGTQYRSRPDVKFKPGDKMEFELSPLDEGAVSDAMRAALGCPTLEEAKKRAKDF